MSYPANIVGDARVSTMRLHTGDAIRIAILAALNEALPGLRSLNSCLDETGWRSANHMRTINIAHSHLTVESYRPIAIRAVVDSLAMSVLRDGTLKGVSQVFEDANSMSVVVGVLEMEPTGEGKLAEAKRIYAERYRLVASQCESALPPFTDVALFHRVLRRKGVRAVEALTYASKGWTLGGARYRDLVSAGGAAATSSDLQPRLEQELNNLWLWYMGVVRGEITLEDK